MSESDTPLTDALVDDMLSGNGIPQCAEVDRLLNHARALERRLRALERPGMVMVPEELAVTVDKEGVRFGKWLWVSHEKIMPHGNLMTAKYRDWVNGMLAACRAGGTMTDLELTRLCAEAMGYEVHEDKGIIYTRGYTKPFAPLENDAQAMALVFWLAQRGVLVLSEDRVMFEPAGLKPKYEGGLVRWVFVMRRSPKDKRRAIVECVARMQKERT